MHLNLEIVSKLKHQPQKMKVNLPLLLVTATTMVVAKECCQFVAIAAYANKPKQADGHYQLKEAKGTAAEKYGHTHYYVEVHASGKSKNRPMYAVASKGKWNFVRNLRRIPRKPTFTPFKECLEDTDKDNVRTQITLDTKCYYPPGSEAPPSSNPIDCKLDPTDTWKVPNDCPAPSCTTFDTVDAWNVGSGKNEFGWALKVAVPEAIPSIGWTIAIRVPKQSRGTFESWVSSTSLLD